MEPDDSMHIFTGHSGELYCFVACSPVDATLVATGGSDDRGFMWKIGEGDWACELSGMRQVPLVNVYLYLRHILLKVMRTTVSSLVFSGDGQLLASGSFDG
ncbi:hypothetical protein Dimus_029462 [Dionaea muscipula]